MTRAFGSEKTNREIAESMMEKPFSSGEPFSSDAMPSERIFSTCPKHGRFEVLYAAFHGSRRFFGKVHCSNCVDEANAEVERIEKELNAKDDEKRLVVRIGESGVSARNMGKNFDSYTADTKEKESAKAKALRVAELVCKKETAPNLIMCGSVGTGKTHLASAMVEKCVRAGKRVRLVRLIEIIRAIKETWARDSGQTEQGMINFFTGLDLLIIDEVGVQFGSDTEKMFIFDIIDGRYQNMLPTVLISNLDVNGVKEIMGERVIDRLREDGGSVVAMAWESYRGNCKADAATKQTKE